MDETKLCFFEEISPSHGKRNSTEVHEEFTLNFRSKAGDEIFKKINEGKWMEVLQSTELTSDTELLNKDQKLGFAVAALLGFVQSNFTGPGILDEVKTFSSESINIERISVDGIELNPNIGHLPLLNLSRDLLEKLIADFPDDLVSFLDCRL